MRWPFLRLASRESAARRGALSTEPRRAFIIFATLAVERQTRAVSENTKSHQNPVQLARNARGSTPLVVTAGSTRPWTRGGAGEHGRSVCAASHGGIRCA